MAELATATKDKLAAVSTATLTSCLFKRGLRQQLVEGVQRLNPAGGAMVGPAFTLRNIPAREDLDTFAAFENPAHPQRAAIETCPSGAVLVIDSRKDARAASAGDILVSRLMVRGVAGIVTDGGFRDSAQIAALAIPAYHQRPAPPVSIARHHAVDLQVPIACGDVAVYPGDVVVGDADGVVVIPAHLADAVAAEAFEMTAFEDFVTEQVLDGRSIVGLYPPTEDRTRAEFAAWRQARGR